MVNGKQYPLYLITAIELNIQSLSLNAKCHQKSLPEITTQPARYLGQSFDPF